MVRKLLTLHLKDRIAAILAVLLLAVLLIPLLRLAIYACPWYDDYLFLNNTRVYMQAEGGMAGFFHGVWITITHWWYTWQGSFSSIFFMAVNPFIFGEEYYFLGIVVVLLFTVTAIFFFVSVLCRYVLKAENDNCCICATVVTTTLIELIYSAQEGIYYYNAAVHYTFMHSCMFLALAWSVKILYDENKRSIVWHVFVVSFLGILCGGSNYVTSLQGICFLVSIFVLGILTKNKKSYFLLIPLFFYGVAFGINVVAPGNSVRAENFQGCGAMEAIGRSFLQAANSFWELIGPMTFVAVLLFIPVAWNMVRKLNFSFRYPLLVSVYSFCMYAMGFTSSFYAMGVSPGASRIWVPIKFTFQMLFFVNLLYWIGWLIKKRKRETSPIKHYVLYYLTAGILAVIIFSFTGNQAGSYSSYGAYYYVHTGEANEFRRQYLQRVEKIQHGGEVVELEPLVWRPWFLYKGDLSEDSGKPENVSMAMWYEKFQIYIKTETDS